MNSKKLFVGLDTHKATIAIAIAEDGRDGEVRYFGQIANTPTAVLKLTKKLCEKSDSLSFCYEAGPCGYGLHRQLTGLGHDCAVISPSHTPTKPGVHVKTDRRDALQLARLHRAGDLTSIWVPDEAHEAVRDLVRARLTTMVVLKKQRQVLQGFLLRQGRIFPGKTHWTKTHFAWIRAVAFDHPAHFVLVEESLAAIGESQERLVRLDQQITKLLPDWRLAPVVKALQALRGISELAAVILAAEIGDFRRFVHPQQLVSYLGLAPSEHSSGRHIVRGPITKAGTAHGRRILIEGAWAYRQPARVSNYMARRQAGLAKDALAIGWKAQVRLCQRFRSMRARGKHHNIVVTAVAREMACFIWALARTVPLSSEMAIAT